MAEPSNELRAFLLAELELSAKLNSSTGHLPGTPLLPSSGQMDSLCLYARDIVSWSKKVDLVSASTPQRVLKEHVVDSITAHWSLTAAGILPRDGETLDIGSGAGFPGLVFAILSPSTKTTLLEPREKRSMFLKEMRRVLALPETSVVTKRAEEFLRESGARFSLVTGRALGDEVSFADSAPKFLTTGGVGAHLTGEGRKRGAGMDGGAVETLRYALPGLDNLRVIEVWKCFT